MSTRTSSTLALLLLAAACSSGKDAAPGGGASASSSGGEAASGEERIDCALAGAPTFAKDCLVDKARQGDRLYLVVRHPDGAFRRFEVLKDGRGLAAADGADAARTSLDGNILEVTVGRDRYRFPATPRSHVASH